MAAQYYICRVEMTLCMRLDGRIQRCFHWSAVVGVKGSDYRIHGNLYLAPFSGVLVHL